MSVLYSITLVFFVLSCFLIFWSMFGYGYSLKIIDKIFKKEKPCTSYKYTVTVMIVAHNEESVIYNKLVNVIDNDYCKEKIKYIVASDNSTDKTNDIVNDFIKMHPEIDMKLYVSKVHNGKTNAQNEAQECVDTDILVMTDANSIFERNAISELVSSFAKDDIKYVCGALKYINTENITASSEYGYWKRELELRSIESRIKTITAGNGAIYACRNNSYIRFSAIESHDSSMPYYFGLKKQRAVFNEKAIAYEKAGENAADEYNRKVRMNRIILLNIKKGFKAINIFKYGWFSYFYFGHRTSRYLLWINHLIVFICNIILVFIYNIKIWEITLVLQILFYMLGFIGKNVKWKPLYTVFYYCMTILSQWKGVINCLTGKSKSTWEKAKSTR